MPPTVLNSALKKKSKYKRPGADPFTGPREVCSLESLTMIRCIMGLGLDTPGEAEGSCDKGRNSSFPPVLKIDAWKI